MNFEEHAGKKILATAGIALPAGDVVSDCESAVEIANKIGGGVIIKAQAPTGKRGKAGGIRPAHTSAEVRSVCNDILGMTIGDYTVERVLVEALAPIEKEYYAAVLNDPDSKGPMIMFSEEGGMEIEEIAADKPDALLSHHVDITHGFDMDDAVSMLTESKLGSEKKEIATVLTQLYHAWRDHDAELLEINPLARLQDGRIVALDCKFTLDDSAIKRREKLAANGSEDKMTALEQRAKDLDLKFIELDGDIGVLANGAGLTMTTMDVIAHHGGQPANFLEIGGEAYTRATEALALVLDNPEVKALVVNFCGAFARTDVMTEGVINAWEALKPDVPVFFAIHGTGSIEARAMLKDRLEMTPYPTMDDAIVAAISAAREVSA